MSTKEAEVEGQSMIDQVVKGVSCRGGEVVEETENRNQFNSGTSKCDENQQIPNFFEENNDNFTIKCD